MGPAKNYSKEEEQLLSALRETEYNTAEQVLQCGRDVDRKEANIKDNTEEEWEEVVQIFRENKRKREERRKTFRKKEEV